MQDRTLQEWLTYIKSLHQTEIDLGLERPREVASRLNVLNPNAKVVIVAGTNGKGSTVAGLEAIYLAAGYKVGAFTSPYLFRFNEMIRLQGKEANDERICQAFAQIETVRGNTSLTPFEFNTLAALSIFKSAELDVYLLEVGLGGRLDAVNIMDADVAIVTSIAIDHTEWLGNTRELIAREKAGIFREKIPAVYGDESPPQSLLDYAKTLNVLICQHGKDFHFESEETSWQWQSAKTVYKKLPLPSLALANMANVLMAIELMQPLLPIKREAIDSALHSIKLPGRIQVVEGPVTRIFDVSHNPAGAEWLAEKLKTMPCQGKTRAIFSMLADKDIRGTIHVIKDQIDEWHIAQLSEERAAPLAKLLACFAAENIAVLRYQDLKEAYHSALMLSQPGDRVIVFGSFHVVAAFFSHVNNLIS